MIEEFITQAIKNGGWMEMDRQYLANKIYELVGKDEDYRSGMTGKEMAEALAKKASEDEGVQYMIFVQLLEYLAPPPSVVNACFAEHFHQSPERATSYYHDLLNGIGFFQTSYAKKPLDFLNFYAEGTLVSMNNRFIRMNLGGQSWGFQLLPNEKEEVGLIFPEYEAQFSTTKKVLEKLFEITEVFPHYQISTNAGWFDTKKLETLSKKSASQVSTSSELVEATVFEQEKILELSSYNIQELIRMVKKIEFKAYQTLTGFREGNQFFLRVCLRKRAFLQESIQKISG